MEGVYRDESLIGYLTDSVVRFEDRDDSRATINSISPELILNISEVVSGTVSYEELGLNDIVLNKYRVDRSDINYNDINVGDVLDFEFMVDDAIVKHSFRVAGIAYFPSMGLYYATSDSISEISPYDNVAHLSVFASSGRESDVQEKLNSLISGNPNLRIKVYEEEFTMIQGFVGATMYGLYGLSAFVIVFGIFNMVNMLINSAILRKREFALLRAVGMTNSQLQSMLYLEGLDTSLKSVIIATLFGSLVGWLFSYLANEVMGLKFILFEMNYLALIVFTILLIGLQIIVSYSISRYIEKDSLTERLRAI